MGLEAVERTVTKNVKITVRLRSGLILSNILVTDYEVVDNIWVIWQIN